VQRGRAPARATLPLLRPHRLPLPHPLLSLNPPPLPLPTLAPTHVPTVHSTPPSLLLPLPMSLLYTPSVDTPTPPDSARAWDGARSGRGRRRLCSARSRRTMRTTRGCAPRPLASHPPMAPMTLHAMACSFSLSRSLSLSLPSLSLSLSLTHTHTHTLSPSLFLSYERLDARTEHQQSYPLPPAPRIPPHQPLPHPHPHPTRLLRSLEMI
jgi:hypothetical protein